jgi:hypothetical protein
MSHNLKWANQFAADDADDADIKPDFLLIFILCVLCVFAYNGFFNTKTQNSPRDRNGRKKKPIA